MNKYKLTIKGFTLIELLGIIVILAIIALIAVPVITNIINKTTDAAFANTVRLIAKNAEIKKFENYISNKNDVIECNDVVNINDADYETCNISFEGEEIFVTLIGKGKFKDLAVIDGTVDDVKIISAEIARFIPKNAVRVKTEEELVKAVEDATSENPNILLKEPIALTNTITISDKKISIYSVNHENKLSISKNDLSIFEVNDKGTLEIYNVLIDQNYKSNFDEGGYLVIADLNSRQTVPLIKVNEGSNLLLDKNTVISNVTSKTNIILVSGTSTNRATATLNNTTITNCTMINVVNASGYADVYLNEGTKIINNIAYNNENHGIIRIYTNSVVNINGANIDYNYYNGNGMIGIYNATLIMNDGTINNNTAVAKSFASIDNLNSNVNNVKYGLIYVHSGSSFTMNGGIIKNNKLLSHSAVDSMKINGKVILNNGTITNNMVKINDEIFDYSLETYYYNSERFEMSDSFNITGRIYDCETKEYIYKSK